MSLSPVWLWMVGMGVLLYGVAPLSILFRMKMRIDPDPPPLDPERRGDCADEAFFDKVQASLEDKGFVEVGRFHLDRIATNVNTNISLLMHPEEEAAAFGTAIRRVTGRRARSAFVKRHIQFCTELSDGRQINTNDIATPLPVGENPYRLIVHCPKVRDPAALWAIHQAVVRDALTGAKKKSAPVDQFARSFFGDVLRRDMDEKVSRGLWRKIGDGMYRPTLRGAYLITWGELPPIKQIRTWQMRRRTTALRHRLGV